ncbi:MAG: hypothetical protein QXU97_01575 [Fervidicoccaceae archaeon]
MLKSITSKLQSEYTGARSMGGRQRTTLFMETSERRGVEGQKSEKQKGEKKGQR